MISANSSDEICNHFFVFALSLSLSLSQRRSNVRIKATSKDLIEGFSESRNRNSDEGRLTEVRQRSIEEIRWTRKSSKFGLSLKATAAADLSPSEMMSDSSQKRENVPMTFRCLFRFNRSSKWKSNRIPNIKFDLGKASNSSKMTEAAD